MKLHLPFWMNQGILGHLTQIAQNYYTTILNNLQTLAIKDNALTCSPQTLELLAYHRSITRIAKEPIEIYRLRIHHALQNSIDAGSIIGFQNIFNRIGLPVTQQIERDPLSDWDIIYLTIQTHDLGLTSLIEEIARQYGRTCRRYAIQATLNTPQTLRLIQTNYEKQTIALTHQTS